MAFDNSKLIEKLRGLNSSQQSIETVSMYCQVQKRAAKDVVATWHTEFIRAAPPKKVALLYLANDILQHSRKKGPEFVAEFHRALPKVLRAAMASGDDKARRAASRLVGIWQERHVFGSHAIKPLKDAVKDAEAQGKAMSSGGGNRGSGAATTSSGARGGSNLAGGSSRRDTMPGAPQGDGGSSLQQLKWKLVEQVADILYEVHESSTRRAQLMARRAQLPQVFVGAGTETLASSSQLLLELVELIGREAEQRTRASAVLQGLANAQGRAMQPLAGLQGECEAQLAQVQAAAAAAGLPPQQLANGHAARSDAGADAAPAGVEPDVDISSAAAQLAAHLAAGGNTEALLEAIAALPEDQQASLNQVLQQPAAGGSKQDQQQHEGGKDALAAMAAAAPAADPSFDEDDEYDPTNAII